MITQLHVFDFDGTLVDSSHRYRVNPATGKIDLDYWIANEHRALEDKPLPLLNYFLDLQDSPNHYPIIATARIWCDLSQQWAAAHGIRCHVIARRDRSDNRGGAALKVTGVRKLLNLKQFANVAQAHVYEDNAAYLRDICAGLPVPALAHFFPSNQGH
jgi:phosphoglycolate phosphatase-like HAD superfamily hydrolase